MKEFSEKTILATKQIAVDGRDKYGQGGGGEVTHAYVEDLGISTPDYFLVAMVKVKKTEGGDSREIEFDVMIQRDGKQFAARVRQGGPGSRDWKNITRRVLRDGGWAVQTHFKSIRQAIEHAVCNPHC